MVSHRTGAQTVAQDQPGQTAYGPITLERGGSHDAALRNWAAKIWGYPNAMHPDNGGQPVSLEDFRRDVAIWMQNVAGNVAMNSLIRRRSVSDFIALPDRDGAALAIAIQRWHWKIRGLNA